MVSLRRDVIGEVMSVYKESCPSLEELIAINKEFKTPLTAIKLDIKDLVTIIEELTILNQLDCTKWYQFGLHLGLYDPRLKAIDTAIKRQWSVYMSVCLPG
uniref:Uncharacterized protein n=1 Tax=Amphimedon queenslandica TaxID=400682 RepID=A0A1X7UDK1_AMPQE